MQNLYYQIYSFKNLGSAYKKARKHKTKKLDVLKFEENLLENLQEIQFELMTQTYLPKPLKTFILRDPKSRKISKSEFRDRIVHHALINIIQPVFEKSFIYDSCANQKGKGNLFALGRFNKFKRKVTNNLNSEAFCLKADIKHYFQEVNHEILLEILKRKVKDEKVLSLIRRILENGFPAKGMPLGNLTSQFLANVYLNELDFYVKNKLRVRNYIRYVDDFVILNKNKEQLEVWKKDIDKFLKERLNLELHKQKTRIISLSRGIDFVGFRNFYHYRILRKRNIQKMKRKAEIFVQGEISQEKFLECFQGWGAYAKWADTFKLRTKIVRTSGFRLNPSEIE